MADIQKILSPVDFSDASEHALRYALDLATRLGSTRVHLIHVYQIPTYSLPDGSMLAPPDFVATLTTELQKQMDEVVRRYAGHGIELTSEVSEGVAYVEITRAAEKVGAQLIVMGTHGRTGLSHFLIGSVAERVVRTSHVPVLTVRKPD